jgi:2-amino-4-hydroxy-6-hydroxymethyldihydropteridine diphosphokinase
MILIGLGGNLSSASGAPPETFRSALEMLARNGVKILKRSSLFASPPWPSGEGPPFYNQAVVAASRLAPGALMQLLLKVEAAHGRLRREKWGPRTLDLDLLDYRGMVTDSDYLALPHPWIEERAFVLKPIAEIAPDWRHPVTGRSARVALSALNPAEIASCLLSDPQ